MRGIIQRLRTLSAELQRRRVYRAAVLYAVAGFALWQGSDLLVGANLLPDWVVPLGGLLYAAGFPVAVVLAWALQYTPEGLQPDETPAPGLGGWVARGVVLAVAIVISGGVAWWGWVEWVQPGAQASGSATPVADPGPLDPARVAVLYFDDHSPGRELGYLADGLTESLLHELAQVPALEVISRNAAAAYRDGEMTLDSLLTTMRVGSLVEGSVSRSDGVIKVTVQLVDVESDVHLASRVLERPDEDLFTLESQLAQEVALILRERLGPEIRLREWQRGTESVEAWTTLRRAMELRDEYTRVWEMNPNAGVEGLLDVYSMLAEAERLDPGWVDPVIARGWVAYDLAERQGDLALGELEAGWIDRAHEHAGRAVALAPRKAAAHELRGVVLAAMGGSGSAAAEEAEEELRRAIELDRSVARAWGSLSTLLMDQDRYPEARWAARQALEADAFLEDAEGVIGTLYESALMAGPEEEARRWCNEGRRRFPENANFVLCRLYLLASFPQVEPDLGLAWRLLDTLDTVASARNRDGFRRIGEMQVAKVAARLGLDDSARAIIRHARGSDAPAWLAYDEAHARLLLGERDVALRLLPAYLEITRDTARLARDWWFEALHDDPGFRGLVGF